MRVTQSSMSMTALAGLQNDLAALSQTQEQLSTGRVLNKPSDDPAGTVVDMQARAAISRNTQYGSNATDGLGWLGSADTALKATTADLQRVSTLLIQAQNGTMNSTAMQALGAEVTTIQQDVLSQANTTYNGQPIFAGSASVTAAYSASGTYQGNNQAVVRQVSDQTRVPVSVTGTTAFGTAPNDVFTVLNQVASDLNSGAGPSAIAADMTNLNNVMATVSAAHTTVGAAYDRVQSAQTTASNLLITLQSTQASVESTDVAKATVTFASQQVSYQAALAAAAKAIQPSLLQFLS